MGRILSQCVHISNYHILHFKYLTVLSMIPPIRLEKKKERTGGNLWRWWGEEYVYEVDRGDGSWMLLYTYLQTHQAVYTYNMLFVNHISTKWLKKETQEWMTIGLKKGSEQWDRLNCLHNF